MVNFGIPLFANIHLCGSVLTEVFFVMTISQILYGKDSVCRNHDPVLRAARHFCHRRTSVPGGTWLWLRSV